MDELHSIACSSTLHSCSSLGWDFLDLQDISPFMESSPPFLSSIPDSDLSTGYLQDALFKFTSKRRRFLFFDDDHNYQSTDSTQQNSTIEQHFPEDYDPFKCDSFSGDPSKMASDDNNSNFREVKMAEEEAISDSIYYSSSPNTHYNTSDKEYSTHPCFSTGGGKQKKRRMRGKVVYPFGVVKPGGQEGEVTLNDINQRILMRPTRPVRHPVGDFACRPTVSPAGPGLSGKTVVALTKIHTQGSGTITIIRTRG